MDSRSEDTLQRALSDLQTWASQSEITRQKQRCDDLKAEIDKKNQHASDLNAQREDALRAAELAKEDAALSFAFQHRASILLEEFEKSRPHGLIKKWREECDRLEQMHLSARILDGVKTLDFADGS